MTHREVLTRRLEVHDVRTSFGKITRIMTEKSKKSKKNSHCTLDQFDLLL